MRAALCLVIAFAIGSIAGGAHAREGDGGRERDKQPPGHETKQIALRDRELRVHEFFDRIGGNPIEGSDGGDSSGKGGTGGKEGSCSRC